MGIPVQRSRERRTAINQRAASDERRSQWAGGAQQAGAGGAGPWALPRPPGWAPGGDSGRGAAAEQQADSICLGRQPRSAPGEGSSPGEALPQGSCSPRRSAARATPTARARVSGSSRAPPRCRAVPGSSALCFLSGPLRRGSPGAARERGGWEGVQEAVALSGGSSAPSPGDGLSQREPRWLPGGPGTDGAPVQGWTARGACPLAAVGTDSGTLLPSPPAPPCLPEASPKQSSMGRGEGPPSQPVGTRARRPSGPGVPKRRLLLAAGVRQLQAPVGSRARPPTLPPAGVRAGWSPELTQRPNPQSQVVTLFEISGRRCG